MASKAEKFAAVAKENEEKKKSAAALAKGRQAANKGTKKEDETPAKKKESGEMKGISFRVPEKTIEDLKILCRVTGQTATGWFINAVEESCKLRAADVEALKKMQEK